ncbi:hypothetical protein Atai01_54100 [Amycolatopsis taiwanensis]|uniref:Uncharacterized protein n=1 Tax=Amycolatopsis taiwanensis TaxID=342230 RepID=A0A9W6R4J6_9PSEU|nr:hypothetical protein Atai01_54100 [Amycolatopsis taiwanensis]
MVHSSSIVAVHVGLRSNKRERIARHCGTPPWLVCGADEGELTPGRHFKRESLASETTIGHMAAAGFRMDLTSLSPPTGLALHRGRGPILVLGNEGGGDPEGVVVVYVCAVAVGLVQRFWSRQRAIDDERDLQLSQRAV